MQQTPPDVLAWLASQVGLDAHLAKQKSATALPPLAPRIHTRSPASAGRGLSGRLA